MNKIYMIGFLGGFSTVLYCLIQNNKENKENKENNKKENKYKVVFNKIKYKDEIKISSDKLILYEQPRPIYELYLKSDWEIL